MSKPQHPALDALRKLVWNTQSLPRSTVSGCVNVDRNDMRRIQDEAIPALEALLAEREALLGALGLAFAHAQERRASCDMCARIADLAGPVIINAEQGAGKDTNDTKGKA